MFLWDQALNNEKVVKLSSLEQAFTPQHTKPKVLTTNYGLGWRMKQLENGEWLTYHTGWWHGFKNYYLHNPKDNSAIIILGNNANQSLSKINIVQSILYPEKSKYFLIKIATILSEILKTKPLFNFEISIQLFKKITGQKLFSLK